MAGQTDRQTSLKTFDPSRMYDITAEERQAMQERAKMRAEMRMEYQKKLSSPYRGVGGYVFDPAIQRFLSMRANHFEQFKPSPKNAAFGFFTVVLPIIAFWWKLDKDKKDLEYKCRHGLVAYKDRDWKFI